MFLEVTDLHHIYQQGTPFEVSALKGVNFSAQSGEFLGIMGATGSGKSTLLQHLNGLLKPTQGDVKVGGESIFTGRLSMKNLRTRLGMVFQHPEQQLFAETVFQEVSFGPQNQGLSPEEVESRVKDALKLVSLDDEHLQDRSPFELSGGQMRRLALAGVLAMEPEILILDEPTSGLDPQGKIELLGHIAELHQQKGLTVIMVSHLPQEILPQAHRILILHQGRVALEGSPREVFSRPRELEHYGIDLPPPVRLAEGLRQRGFFMSEQLLTEEEVCEEIFGSLYGLPGKEEGHE